MNLISVFGNTTNQEALWYFKLSPYRNKLFHNNLFLEPMQIKFLFLDVFYFVCELLWGTTVQIFPVQEHSEYEILKQDMKKRFNLCSICEEHMKTTNK